VENNQQTNWQVWALLSPVPVLANFITSQLVKNGAHKTMDQKSSRMVKKELSDLWKVPTPEGHSISELFKSEELACALRRLKPGKSPELDSIFRSSYSTPRRLSNPGFATSSVPAYTNSKFQRSREEH